MKKNMRKVSLILVVILMVLSFTGCAMEKTVANKTSDQIQSEKAERMNKQKTLRIGEPNIVNFNEANQVKDIYEKRDNPELICHAYLKNRDGMLIYLGMSKGFGVNASIQFSNPLKVMSAEDDYGIRIYDGDLPILLPQAEPNGLNMPEGLSATYINLYNEKLEEFGLAYIEDNLNVFEHKQPARLCVKESLPEDY